MAKSEPEDVNARNVELLAQHLPTARSQWTEGWMMAHDPLA
ncbi:MAG: hypothetical protein AAGH73_12975 [Pseudomonadota bacterium]